MPIGIHANYHLIWQNSIFIAICYIFLTLVVPERAQFHPDNVVRTQKSKHATQVLRNRVIFCATFTLCTDTNTHRLI